MTDEELLIWLRVEDTNLTDFAADRIEELLAERKKDHANINLKADFIDKTINQLAEADTKLAKAVEAAEEMSAAFYSDGNVTERHLRACKAGVKLNATLAAVAETHKIKGESHE